MVSEADHESRIVSPFYGMDLRPRARITTVIGSLSGGGAERCLLQLSEELALRGYRVTLLTVDPHTPDFYSVPSTIERRRAHPDAFMDCRWFNVRCRLARHAALRNALLETAPDLVISFIDIVNVITLLSLWRDRVPVVVSECIDPRYHAISRRWRVLRWLTYPLAARVVMVAEETLDWAAGFWPRWRADAIENAVFPRVGVECCLEGRAPHRVIGVGRLQRQKGFDLLIRAFASISAQFPTWRVEIYGEGPDLSFLEGLAGSLGVGDRVRLAGAVKEPFADVGVDDLFVFSSRYEGFGMALGEAMAAGMPVISFDCPSGPGRIIRHGVDGLLVPPEDVNALADAMRRLMREPTERKRLAARAPEVTERFSPARIYDRWEGLIQDVLREAA